MQFVLYSEKTLLPHYCLHAMCHSKSSWLLSVLFWVYFLVERALVILFIILLFFFFLSFKVSFNNFSPSLPHYCLAHSVYQSFVVLCEAWNNGVKYVWNTFMRFSSFPLYFTTDHFQWVYWTGLTFFLLYWWNLGGCFQRNMWKCGANNHKAYSKTL